MSPDILVVSADPHVLSDRVTALRRAGFSARASSSFPDARRILEEGPAPEILVTDVRLGPYNGLHLVAIALGADGINMGSRFMCTVESAIHQNVKEAIVAGSELDTEYRRALLYAGAVYNR